MSLHAASTVSLLFLLGGYPVTSDTNTRQSNRLSLQTNFEGAEALLGVRELIGRTVGDCDDTGRSPLATGRPSRVAPATPTAA
jgi:hypothetical protein